MKKRNYKIKKRKGVNFIYLIILFLLINSYPFQNLNAQVYTIYNDSALIPLSGIFSGSKKTIYNIDSIITPKINIDSLIKLPISVNGPFKFGQCINVKYNLENSGSWENVSAGRIWKLKIISDSAFSLNLIFDEFHLPDSASLYIYNNERTIIFGPVTSLNCGSNGVFASAIFKDNAIIIEYFEPYSVFNQGIIEISKVIHGYQNIFPKLTSTESSGYENYGASGFCEYDIVCPDGNEWCKEARADALILIDNGSSLASGVMINNVNNDFTPYLLTANHVYLASASTLSTTGFWFHYKNPSCNAINASWSGVYISYIGATLVANDIETDYALLKLSNYDVTGNNITTNLNKLAGIHFSGWTENPDLHGFPIVGIHHPYGDVMKISTDLSYPVTLNSSNLTVTNLNGTTYNVFAPNSLYKVSFNHGDIYFGSSGSPIYDYNHKIFGQLCTGTYGYCTTTTSTGGVAYYGNFGQSMIYDSNPLQPILDPNNTYSSYLDDIGPPIIFHNQTVTGNPLLWTASNEMELAGNVTGYPPLPPITSWPGNNNTFNYSSNSLLWFYPVNGYPFIEEPGANLTCQAGDRITIKAGVHIERGAYFHAYIAPVTCNEGLLDYQSYRTVHNSTNPHDNQITDSNSVSIFPNPNDGNMHVYYEIPENETGTLIIYSMIGEKLLSFTLKGGKNTLNISEIKQQSGVYFYSTYVRNKKIASGKIVIIK